MKDGTEAGVRLFDANANRAAEGLRTLEDVARFIYNDAFSARVVKESRHRLGELCGCVDRSARLLSRSTATDIGVVIKTQGELTREDWSRVVQAAVERVLQSLRCLEESAKLIVPMHAPEFEQLRYQAYDRLATVELRLASPLQRIDLGSLYLLVDCQMPIDSFVSYLRQLSEAGVGVFQVRDKRADGGQLLQYSRAAMQTLHGTDSKLIVNDRVDIALASGAHGVHVGQEDLRLADVQQVDRQRRLLVGVSTHSVAQAVEATEAGADYIGCGPTFASNTKSFSEFVGVELIREVMQLVAVPAYAIGGIALDNVDAVIAAGGKAIAVSGAIHSATDPARTARELRQKLDAVNAK